MGPVNVESSAQPGSEESGMPSLGDWKIPPAAQPRVADYAFDLDRALSSVVSLSAHIPSDAFTAETLGTERAGHGVLIRDDGVVLTIGYLITEAQSVWLTTHDGRAVEGHVLGYDQATGFGLVQALGRLELPALPLGRSASTKVGDRVVAAGAGGRQRSVAAHIVAKQEFAGYWEYVLDEAIFTAPAHPHWGGTALIGPAGDLIGIGSLQVQHGTEGGRAASLNMVVPIDLLKPVLEDLVTLGRPNRPARPWLGVFAADVEDKIVIMGLAANGPAQRAGLRTGDLVLAVGGTRVSGLAAFFRRVWALGDAGVAVPLTLHREGDTFEVSVTSGDRNRFLKGPQLH
jgi:S1-C subfamily serine protease